METDYSRMNLRRIVNNRGWGRLQPERIATRAHSSVDVRSIVRRTDHGRPRYERIVTSAAHGPRHVAADCKQARSRVTVRQFIGL